MYVGQGGQQWIHELLYRRAGPAMVSELADVELPSLLSRSQRDHVISDEELQGLLGRYDVETDRDGPIGVHRLSPATYALARQIVLDEVVGTLDAVHLAGALQVHRRDPVGQPVTFVTLDRRQAVAGRRLGLTVADGPPA
ncbi:MAG TPA: type II toxin-antitoxin system VapC family toxin [Acidimicrobiales bacterium]|nr:type II toxin-antitoxin system VapC family toxin [Acidimicrobiales bacterium]